MLRSALNEKEQLRVSDDSTKVSVPINKRNWHPSPLPGLVVLVTTIDAEGRPNMATKSWITMSAFGPPPVLMFGCNLGHATAQNVLLQKEFVVNVPGDDLRSTVWGIGTDLSVRGEERFHKFGLTPTPSESVKPPRIIECKAHLECHLDSSREWGQEVVLFGTIEAMSMDEALCQGTAAERYSKLAPFFYLEGAWGASLGKASATR